MCILHLKSSGAVVNAISRVLESVLQVVRWFGYRLFKKVLYSFYFYILLYSSHCTTIAKVSKDKHVQYT